MKDNLNSGMIIRISRGIIGVVLVIAGVLNNNWIGLLGIFLLFSAIRGGCGFGSSSCEIKADQQKQSVIP